ncbi:hypothetical protein RintRC_7530 [Richelia intracellularis]|nr:hypothetical protein RintRC_7530 [Richelia intracellularis]
MEQLRKEIYRDERGIISLCYCEREYVEVTLWGSWLTDRTKEDTGIFVTSISDLSDGEYLTSRIESLLYNLWLAAESCASVVGE